MQERTSAICFRLSKRGVVGKVRAIQIVSSVGSDWEHAANEALRRGDSSKAMRLCREALSQDPDNARCNVLLARLLRQERNHEQSAAVAEQAIRIKPDMAEAHFELGMNMLALGRAPQAATSLKKSVELNSDAAPFHYNLGVAFETLGRDGDATSCYREAVRLDPKDLAARLCLVAQCLKASEIGTAKEHAEAALRIAPKVEVAQLLMAEVLQAEFETTGAEECIRKALAVAPNSSVSHAMLGFRQSQKGRFDEAHQAFRRSMQLNPRQGLAYLGLTQTRKIGEADRELVRQMEQVKRGGQISLREAGFLQFALGKAYEDLGQYELAMAAYDEAHRCTYAFGFGQQPYDLDSQRKHVEAIRQAFPNPIAVVETGDPEGSELPIFIVGMIRSGTTLVEQILSSHPEVGAGGEQLFWQNKAGGLEALRELASDPSKARKLAEEYVAWLRKLSPRTSRVTDKLPGNYLRLGLIRQALPKAKIVHCRRNPLDTAISIYATPNGAAPPFSHSKEGIVAAYRQYLRLMEHWRTILPPSSIFEIDYERLIEQPEPIVRELLEFCELEWDDACLRPDQNSKEVSTPSLVQVRQPIYKSSMGRWRHFEPWLGPLKELRDLARSDRG